jgi:hypothetical protein
MHATGDRSPRELSVLEERLEPFADRGSLDAIAVAAANALSAASRSGARLAVAARAKVTCSSRLAFDASACRMLLSSSR